MHEVQKDRQIKTISMLNLGQGNTHLFFSERIRYTRPTWFQNINTDLGAHLTEDYSGFYIAEFTGFFGKISFVFGLFLHFKKCKMDFRKLKKRQIWMKQNYQFVKSLKSK